MAADLRLVADPAQRDPRETATQRARNGLTQRRLADARRSNQGDDRTRAAATDRLEVATFAPLLDGQEFDDALFDVVEPGVVRIQDAAGLGDVEAILRLLAPGQLEHPVQVVADPALLGVLLAGALEAARARARPPCARRPGKACRRSSGGTRTAASPSVSPSSFLIAASCWRR